MKKTIFTSKGIYFTENPAAAASNPNGCDENHCLCPDGAEHCILDNPPPPGELDNIIARILLQLDQINDQIDDINNKLKNI